MSLDFSNAQLPRLAPLAESFSENDVEADLKKLFIDLFNANLAADAFDANVLGSAHLGSFDLVRRAVNMDGLVLMQGDREEAATRYLYRAWKSGNIQGRGVHFLRTYLQLLFPNLCEVEQLWQDKAQPYPTALYAAKPRASFWLYALGEPGLKLNGSWGIGGQRPSADFGEAEARMPDLSRMFLTSRIEIALDFSVQIRSISSLMHIIRSVIPARLLPLFRFMLRFVLYAEARLSTRMLMEKQSGVRYPWCGKVIGDSADVRWSMGRDGVLVKLPLAFGTFRLGEIRGGLSVRRLKACRIDSSALAQISASAGAYRMPKLGEVWRRLDGSWRLAGRIADADSSAFISASSQAIVAQSVGVTHHENIRMDYPATPSRLSGFARLSSWRRLDGKWSVGSVLTRRPFGFAVRRDRSVAVESSATLKSNYYASATPERLTRIVSTRLSDTPRKINGTWPLGAENKIGRFRLDGRRLRAFHFASSPRIGGFALAYEQPGLVYSRDQSRKLKLNGLWGIGGSAAPAFSFKSERI